MILLFYLAMKRYALAFHDNHMFLKRKGFEPFEKTLKGHYGFEIARLSNNQIIITQIRLDTTHLPPEIKSGIQIIAWNNVPIYQAIKQVSLLTAESGQASIQNEFLYQCKYLMHDTIGAVSKLTLLTENQDTLCVNIKAFSCKQLEKEIIYPSQSLWRRSMKSPVQFDVFDADSIGYIQLSVFMPNFSDLTIPSTFAKKLWILKQLDVKSLIIDLRTKPRRL